jgi:hypothetical protein
MKNSSSSSPGRPADAEGADMVVPGFGSGSNERRNRMKRLKRPSPAMIVAVVALVAGLAGTAIAAHRINGHSVRKHSLPGNRIKKHSVTPNRLKKQLTGSQVNESTLQIVPQASQAAGPIAMAHVRFDGTLDPTQSRGVTQANVSRDSLGRYCFRNLAFSVKSASGMIDTHDSTVGDSMTVAIPDDGLVCGNGTQVGVEIGSAGVFQDDGFYIQFWN